jgi:PAS domain S-box-containing protein
MPERNHPWRVVIVDDNKVDLAEAKAAMLKGSTRRYTFIEGFTAADAVRLCSGDPRPDCAVLDFNLPDGTALEVLAAMPGDGQGLPIIPIVILTGDSSSEESRAVLRAGAQDFVGKNWLTPQSLTRAVENAVARHAMALELRQQGRALEKRELEFRTLADNTPDVLARFDRELRHTFVNNAVERVTGRRRREFLGKTNRELGMPVDLCDRWDKALRRVLDTGVTETIDFDFEVPSGVRSFSGLLVPESDGDGRIESVLSVTRDVTDRWRIEQVREQLLTAERAARSEIERVARVKDEFLATLSHELRTPLNAIVGWAQVLQHGNPDRETIAHGIEVIARNAHAQSQLIKDLLDMSRIVSGKLRLEIEDLDLNRVAAAAVDSIRPATDAKGLRLTLHLAPTPLMLKGDTNRLQQVVWNLLNNAVKFTPAGGQVEVAATIEGEHAVLSVSDDGQGIGPEFMPHLFDRFSQADGSAARKHGGMGLGLSIVKQLVEMHGGGVSAESAGAGQGTRFKVVLPLGGQSLEWTAGVPAEESSDVELTGISVLMVDDQADALELARRLLTEHGAAVTTAASGHDALVRLQFDRPHVLISDIGMPDMDGYRLIEEIRLRLGLTAATLPAIALTAFSRVEDRGRSLAAGYQVHLAKPVEPFVLLTTVAELARKRGELYPTGPTGRENPGLRPKADALGKRAPHPAA